MKFSEIKQEDWAKLQPYLDTCLLPISGLTGKETPYEAAERLERLRDLLDLLERPFRGRTVTYPAYHFVTDMEVTDNQISLIAEQLRTAGFRYIVVVTVMENMKESDASGVDLLITPSQSDQVTELISTMWNS